MEVYDTEYKTFDVGRVNQGYKDGFFSKITIFCHNIRQGKVIKYYCTRFLICLKRKSDYDNS